MEYTQEMIEKARKAGSVEELLALAKENGYELSKEEAEEYFAQMHKSGELSDEELENVSGGGCRKDGHLVVSMLYKCDMWRCREYKWRMSTWKCHTCEPEHCKEFRRICDQCEYCKYNGRIWVCYNPRK